MIYLIIIFFILIIFNILLNTEKFNNIEDSINFNKYRKYSTKLETKYGSCNYTPSKLIEELPQIAWNGYFINDLKINIKYRNKGHGTQLIKQLIKISKDEGRSHLISQVKSNNKAAIKLHDKLGFFIYDKGFDKNKKLVLIYVYYL